MARTKARKRQRATAPADTMAADMIADARQNVTNRHLVVDATGPFGGATVEQYDGEENFCVTLGGFAMDDAAVVNLFNGRGVSFRVKTLTDAAQLAAALIAATEKALAIVPMLPPSTNGATTKHAKR